LSGFGLTIVLMAIVTFIGTSRMNLLNDKMNGIAHIRMPHIVLLYDIMKDYDVIARSARNIALTTDEGIKQKQKDNFAKAKADLTDTLNKLEKTLHSDKAKELFAGVKENLVTVVQLSEKAEALGVANKNQEAGDVVVLEVLAPQTEV